MLPQYLHKCVLITIPAQGYFNYNTQEPPRWVLKPSDLRGIELERFEFKCSSLASPPPTYTWVNKDGEDATEKEGECMCENDCE